MFGGTRLKVSFTIGRSCFGFMNAKYSSTLEPEPVQIQHKDKQIFAWTMFNTAIPDGEISFNPLFCKHVGLEEGAEVFVAPYPDIKILNEIYIDADSADDQEILEHNVETLEYNILDQLRVVSANQKAVVWISPSLPVVFTPKETGLLVTESKIIVKMHAFTSPPCPNNTKAELPVKTNDKFNDIGEKNRSMLEPFLNVNPRHVLRALPIDSDGKRNLIHPYTVFVHEDLLSEKHTKLPVILAIMTKIPGESDFLSDGRIQETLVNVCVEIVPIDNVIYRSLCREVYNKNIPTVLIPKSLNEIIIIKNGRKVNFEIIGDKVEQPSHINIQIYSEENQNEMDVIEKFKRCVVENTHSGKKFLINSGMAKQNKEICIGYLRFLLKPENITYTMLNSESFRNCTVSAQLFKGKDLDTPRPGPSELAYDSKNYCRAIRTFNNLVEKVIAYINFEIQRDATFMGISQIKSNILITGPSGTGKTSICHIIQKDLTMWSHIVHCRSLKGRNGIVEKLEAAVQKCLKHSPAVLICDDFDAIVAADSEGQAHHDSTFHDRLALEIKDFLQSIGSGVCIVFTATSVKSLHKTLRKVTGRPLFTAQFDIPQLDQDERASLLQHLINDKIRESFAVEDDDINRMAIETIGYNVREITDYVNQKIFKAVKKYEACPGSKPRLLEETLKDEEKIKAFDIWGSVGGMDEIKQALTEAIFWPILYPALFPERGCGILLYGPPGSGKSHLGSCLARLANINFISVKGPEILSKYIGQSEKAVRNLFDEAELKRPCILFFDEFDSLAPKRGHDSTGVTDRVVNQFLAKLDGAEGGASGPVVVATSRPDLVDPAMLRPGRLAAHLYCGLPTERDRYEILKVLASNVTLDDEVDLHELAKKTDRFSPADLKALLTTAQLGRLERQLMNSENRNLETVVVYKEDIMTALGETRPSLTREKHMFYDMIYRQFRGESLTMEQKSVIRSVQKKQRATLA